MKSSLPLLFRRIQIAWRTNTPLLAGKKGVRATSGGSKNSNFVSPVTYGHRRSPANWFHLRDQSKLEMKIARLFPLTLICQIIYSYVSRGIGRIWEWHAKNIVSFQPVYVCISNTRAILTSIERLERTRRLPHSNPHIFVRIHGSRQPIPYSPSSR